MRKLKFELHRKALETIYLSFIRPILEYADIVWEPASDHKHLGLLLSGNGTYNPISNT